MEENEIHYADLDPSVGHEQGGTRPVIIIKVLKTLGLCTVVPLTTKMDKLDLQYTLRINETRTTKLNSDSVALIFQVKTISSERLKGAIGNLEGSYSKKIKYLIKEMLGIQ